jgi:arylsulfatase A-like enzyme
MPGKEALRRRTRTAALVLLLAPILAAALAGPSSHASVGGKPNVVVIMTDDQSLADLAYMPKVRSDLADEGVTFGHYYISYPLCCPSRATYLTGQYAHNDDVRENKDLSDGTHGGYYRLDGANTLPVWMQGAGYATGHFGKYLNRYGSRNPLEEPAGWDEWASSPNSDVYKVYDYDLNQNGAIRHYGSAEPDYRTYVETDLATSFIARHAGVPFFLSLAPLAPHNDVDSGGSRNYGTTPAPSDVGAFAGVSVPRPPSFNEKDVSDKPRYIRRMDRFRRRTVRDLNLGHQRRLESLLAVDDEVHAVVRALKVTGQLDNTYILFTSDNGWMLGEHRLVAGKVVPYEESNRVPLIVRGPGIPAGQQRDQLGSNVDLAPTIADIGDATPTLVPDGTSLLPVLENDSPLARPVLLESYSQSYDYRYRGLRVGNWAYVRYRSGEQELYNLARDPYELENLAGRNHQRRRVRRLDRLLTALRTCDGAECQQPAPKL